MTTEVQTTWTNQIEEIITTSKRLTKRTLATIEACSLVADDAVRDGQAERDAEAAVRGKRDCMPLWSAVLFRMWHLRPGLAITHDMANTLRQCAEDADWVANGGHHAPRR